MRASRSRSGSLRCLLLVLLLACGAYPGSAVAAAGKPYTLNLSPATVPAGTQAAFSATFTNPPEGKQQLGSADLAVPCRHRAPLGVGGRPGDGDGRRQHHAAAKPGAPARPLACRDGRRRRRVQPRRGGLGRPGEAGQRLPGPARQRHDARRGSPLTTTISGQELRFVSSPATSGRSRSPARPTGRGRRSASRSSRRGTRVAGQSTEVTIERGSGIRIRDADRDEVRRPRRGGLS